MRRGKKGARGEDKRKDMKRGEREREGGETGEGKKQCRGSAGSVETDEDVMEGEEKRLKKVKRV